MSDTKFLIVGPLESKRTGVNPKDGKAWCRLGFIIHDRAGLQAVELFCPDGYDHSGLFEGSEVEIPFRPYINKQGVLKFAFAEESGLYVPARAAPAPRPKVVS
jgi:hypothetical protein